MNLAQIVMPSILIVGIGALFLLYTYIGHVLFNVLVAIFQDAKVAMLLDFLLLFTFTWAVLSRV